MLCHICISRAEVMRECDIHHTRSINTNSAVRLGRKPGLDLCCDLPQHLHGVLRTCRDFFSLSYVDFARPITHQIVPPIKCNRGSSFAQFCLILFNMLVTISCISYPSLHARYILTVSVRRMLMDRSFLVQSSC